MRTLSATLLVVASLDVYNRTATTDGFPPNELANAMEYLSQARETARTQLERLLGMPVDRMTIDDTGVRQ